MAKITEAMVEAAAQAIWLGQRGASYGLNARLSWRDTAVPNKFWVGYCNDAKAALTAALASSPFTDEDMAAVGRSLMETLHLNCPEWAPAEDPAEIVTDLLNEIADLKAAALSRAKSALASEADPNG